MLKRMLRTHASSAVVLIRLMVALVFVSEGIQKFLFQEQLGPGRFARIGIPFPDVMAPFVGVVEVACGALILIGAGARLAAIPLVIDISVAILSTKVPILLGRGFWVFQLPKLESYGWWSMLHEARTDMSMWLAVVFLLAVVAGPSVGLLWTGLNHVGSFRPTTAFVTSATTLTSSSGTTGLARCPS